MLADEIGLEESYKEYLNKVLAGFNEVHRVLKRTGTLFIVINNTYNTPKLGNSRRHMKSVHQLAVPSAGCICFDTFSISVLKYIMSRCQC